MSYRQVRIFKENVYRLSGLQAVCACAASGALHRDRNLGLRLFGEIHRRAASAAGSQITHSETSHRNGQSDIQSYLLFNEMLIKRCLEFR